MSRPTLSLWRMQVISNMLDFGMEPQMALDAPRFSVFGVDSAEGPCTVRESRWAQPALGIVPSVPVP